MHFRRKVERKVEWLNLGITSNLGITKEVCRAKPGDHLVTTNLGITSNLGINFEAGDHLTWGSIGVMTKTWGSLSKPGDHLKPGDQL